MISKNIPLSGCLTAIDSVPGNHTDSKPVSLESVGPEDVQSEQNFTKK